VIEVLDSSSGLKTSELVSPLFQEGEGSMRGKVKSRWVVFDESQVKLKTLVEQRSQNWLEVRVGRQRGFTPTFPFTNCLE